MKNTPGPKAFRRFCESLLRLLEDGQVDDAVDVLRVEVGIEAVPEISERPNSESKGKMKNESHQMAKKALRDAGISQQAAAEDLGVTFWHLNRVLNNKRHSVSLCIRALELAEKKAVAK